MKHFIIKASIILLTLNATAQIGIGTANPAATLDVVSNRSGFLMPRNADHTTIKKLDGITALDNLDAGMQVFNTTTKTLCYGMARLGLSFQKLINLVCNGFLMLV
jgi:hypothetical protein